MSRSERIAAVWVPALAGQEEEAAAGVERADAQGGRAGARTEGDAPDPGEITAALLSASPRVRRAGPALWHADARGFERGGGEEALADALREAVAAAGFPGAGVGVADVPVAADAAARLAAPGARVVPPGGARQFLAPLPVALLPLSGEMQEILRTLGLRRVGEVAARPREEWEARFGPEGLRLHRWARGEDRRCFRATVPEEVPGASVELDRGVEGMEPLLFLLRRLLDRVCGELAERGRCAARLRIRLRLEGVTRGPGGSGDPAGGEKGEEREVGEEGEAVVTPARPTRRQDVLFDLCRAALERRVRRRGRCGRPAGSVGPLGPGAGPGGEPGAGESSPDGVPWRVEGLALVVDRTAPAEARQGDLFVRRWRDPVQAAAVLSRLRARLGQEGATRPAPRAEHRPERQNRWVPVEEAGERAPVARGVTEDEPARDSDPEGEPGPGDDAPQADPQAAPDDALSPTLRLLPEPVRVEVETDEGRPAGVRDPRGHHRVVAAEGPERLSGDWWRDPYRREYYRVCTEAGELLWLFREYRPDGRLRWWLHGWWD